MYGHWNLCSEHFNLVKSENDGVCRQKFRGCRLRSENKRKLQSERNALANATHICNAKPNDINITVTSILWQGAIGGVMQKIVIRFARSIDGNLSNSLKVVHHRAEREKNKHELTFHSQCNIPKCDRGPLHRFDCTTTNHTAIDRFTNNRTPFFVGK